MMRDLRPHFRWWRHLSFPTVTAPFDEREEARGRCIAIQWLGVVVEINFGRVKR